MIIPVILSGGSGTRLWPLSRELYPKQLLSLTGESSLLQQTLNRAAQLDNVTAPLIICNDEHRFLVAEQLRAIGTDPMAIILEPVGRNTAPATTIAALFAAAQDYGKATLLILPADHLIEDNKIFSDSVSTGAFWAEKGNLVTFGIIPQEPETGFGYIKKGKSLNKKGSNSGAAFEVDSFVEKPDLKTAEQYVASGQYFWNSGMFLFRADQLIDQMEKYAPEILSSSRKAMEKASEDLDFLRLDRESFLGCPSDSIDYALMEKTDSGVVIPINPGWSDIGSWSALWDVGKKDTDGNVLVGDVVSVDTHNSYLYAGNRLLATIGLEDHVIVETADAVLVARKDRVQDVKKIVTHLKSEGRQEVNLHCRVFRPWGSYECIYVGDRYQVKRITVKQKAVLSLQMHHHRAEHWIVVKGTAKITRDDECFVMSENESTYIPLGVKHRLENPGVIPLELIEVQSGSYLDEDDIVRFSDNYGRVEKDE